MEEGRLRKLRTPASGRLVGLKSHSGRTCLALPRLRSGG